jgi:putative ABC transport system permease protein
MLFLEIIRVALVSLRSNPMRSGLTMLGVIIGVAAVITMVALGTGAQSAVEERIQSLGSDLLTVRGGFTMSFGPARSRAQTLTTEDATAVLEGATSITAVVPEYESNAQIEMGNNNLNTEVLGTWANWTEVNNWELEAGRFFNQAEAEGRRRVAVLGYDVAEQLIPANVDPVGAQVRIRGISFEVLGVLSAKGGGFGPTNQDEIVVIPLSTAQWRVFGSDRLSSMTVRMADESMMNMAMAEIEVILRRQHRLRPDQENDFFIASQSQFMELMAESSQTFTLLLAGIASVSLLVGGIGIMNIMLVSVTERTREIGIRKAIGATRGSIQQQFLIEAIVLSCVGGGLGVALAVFASGAMAEQFGWTMVIPTDAVILSFGFAALIGVVFGFYPAMRASRLDPIESLRFE